MNRKSQAATRDGMKQGILIAVLLLSMASRAFPQGEIAGQSPIFYRNEKSVAVLLNTNGVGINGRYAKRINARRKTIFEGDINSIKHKKEVKVSSEIYTANRSYVFGKTNLFFNVRAGYGKQVEMFRKVDRGGISIRRFYSFGPTIGILKPIYYDVVYQISGTELLLETVKFDNSMHGYIYGKASFFKGLDELSVVPGAYGKCGFMFEYSRNDISLHALEAGIVVDVFPKKIPIMATEQNDFLFLGLFVSYRIGKVFDARGFIDEDDLTY